MPDDIEWSFTPDARKESSDDDWYAITLGGYIRPEEILTDPEQVEQVNEAVALLESFFGALYDHEQANGIYR